MPPVGTRARTTPGTVPTLRKALKRSAPSLGIERALWAEGHEVVVGMDEVGRGAWAGPLTLGAAVVPKDRRVNKIRDSKMLTEPEREAIFERIASWCRAWAVGHASQEECDELGMADAQRLAERVLTAEQLALHGGAEHAGDQCGTGEAAAEGGGGTAASAACGAGRVPSFTCS